jgi:RNA polymerase sigma factor (TIGR02999 family)
MKNDRNKHTLQKGNREEKTKPHGDLSPPPGTVFRGWIDLPEQCFAGSGNPRRPAYNHVVSPYPQQAGPSVTDVTRILSAIEQGDPSAAEQLLPLVYDELRKLAAQKMAQENPGHTLRATALVHEAYVRLVDVEQAQHWDSRGHFFSAAAEAMRRILVENARRKRRQKHGGGLARIDLDENELQASSSDDLVLTVDQSLDALAEQNAQAAQLVKLRYFAGLTLPQAAGALGVSPRTADRLWAYAKAWLHAELET